MDTTPSQFDENRPLYLQDVLDAEEAAIVQSRKVRLVDAEGVAERPRDGFTGLALSGGGIRSATFSLGVTQALASRDKLKQFDYLSTVSGGGYLGSFLMAWIRRTGFNQVNAALSQNSASTHTIEPVQIQWLRKYSNYLTPRVGALSMDSLTVVVMWARNTLLNLTILVATVCAVLLLAKFVVALAESPGVHLSNWAFLDHWVAHGLALVSLIAICCNLELDYLGEQSGVTGIGRLWQALLRPKYISIFVVGTGFLAFILGALGRLSDFAPVSLSDWAWLLGTLLALALVWFGFRLLAKSYPAIGGVPRTAAPAKDYLIRFAGALPAVVLLYWLLHLIHPLLVEWSIPVLVTFGPLLVSLCFGIGLCFWIGLVGRRYTRESREWLSRAGAGFVLASLVWTCWLSLALFAPEVVYKVVQATNSWIYGLLTSCVWIGSLIGALVLAMFQPGSKSKGLSKTKDRAISALVAIVAAGIFVAIACGLRAASGDLDLQKLPLPETGYALGAAVLVAVYLAWLVDINIFSMHDLYKMRLIRCYLGASNPDRRAQPFTGFDPADDMPMADSFDPKTGAPFHIVNTSLNLVQGSELAWQQRKAASFFFTARHCGFELTQTQGNRHLRPANAPPAPTSPPAFRPTTVYAAADGSPKRFFKSLRPSEFTLGVAMATSGAAASPNMGVNSSPALAVLMTFANVRLGRWCPNPARKKYAQTSPPFGLGYLLKELAGLTNEDSDFVYLSDGGHFENTAVYELVRRGCMRILVIDAGADPDRTFEDLGNMIHKCRVDLGVEIELPLRGLFGKDDDNRSHCGYSMGSIHYENRIGEILVIKPSLCRGKNEPADVYNYSTTDDSFPQQTTLDQFFDESQFEAYRKLGYDTAIQVLDKFPHFL